MPVPRVGFRREYGGFKRDKRRFFENVSTEMVRLNCIQCRFSALMIGYTITG